MYRGNYRGRGGRGGRGRRPPGADDQRPSGVFKNGYWHCNCSPPIPASYFQVKKDSPNKGRWFYTCARDQDHGETRCGFFLWADQAKVREEAALLNHANNETTNHQGQASDSTDRSRAPHSRGERSPPPPYTPVRSSSASRGKRKENALDDDDDDFPRSFPNSRDDNFRRFDDTPHRGESLSKMRKTDEYSTPSKRRLPWNDDYGKDREYQTPSTSRRRYNDDTDTPRLAYPTPATERTVPMMESPYDRAQGLRRSTSPTPRRGASSANIDVDAPSAHDEVFDILQSRPVYLESDEREKLQSLLKKHDLRAEGLLRGRNISRLSLKAKDAKISELEHRLASVEAELETQKAIVAHMKWESSMDGDL